MKKTTILEILAAAVVAFALAAPSYAATTYTWDGGGDGSSWNVAANWSSDYVPSSSYDIASIGDATADRTIYAQSVTGGDVSIAGLAMSQSSSAVNKLVLDANMSASGNGLALSNNSGSAANLVLDLNGHTLSMNIGGYYTVGPMRIISGTGSGVFQTGYATFQTGAYLGPNVTLYSKTGAGNLTFQNVTFDPNSLYKATYGGAGSNLLKTVSANDRPTFGNIEVNGDGAAANLLLSTNDMVATVAGNVLVSQSLDSIVFDYWRTTLAVKGNFTDHSSTGLKTNYGNSGTLAFYGSPATPSIVAIDHGMNNVSLRIGDNGSSSDKGGLQSADGSAGDNVASNGYVQLGENLSTNKDVTIRGGSRLDVKAYTLSATSGTFTADAGSIFDLTFGSTSGVMNVKNLSLNAFTLNLTEGAGWTWGNNLVLFNYSGTLSGTPAVTLTGDYQGTLATDGGTVRLTNFVVPEPGALALLVIGGVGMIIRRRRA